jgi:hypothetical protein
LQLIGGCRACLGRDSEGLGSGVGLGEVSVHPHLKPPIDRRVPGM